MTLDDFARVVTLVISLIVLGVCTWVIHKDRHAWRVAVPVMFWAASINVWTLVAIFSNPRDVQLLNWWSRLNLWLAAVVVLLLLSLHYLVRNRGHDGNG